MPPSVRVRMTRKQTEGPCDWCPDEIPEGQIHATIVQTFGKSKKGNTKWKASHVHAVDIADWMIADYVKYSRRAVKPGGRPGGTGLDLSKEDSAKRLHIVRTRARLFREIAITDDMDRVRTLYARITALSADIPGGDVNAALARRTPVQRAQIAAKLRLIGIHIEEKIR